MHEAGGHDDGNDDAANACPMQASGTTVTAEDVEGGAAALRFTTTGDVADLRDRLQRMAEMHNRHARGGMHPMRGRSEMMMSPAMMQAEARVEAVEGGARLVFTPADPDQGDGLRDAVRQRAERMAASGQCPMMAQMAARRGGMDMEGMAGMCPMKVTGTTATADDVEGGVALRFTTTGDVAELERRVAAMAEMHTRRGAMMRRGQGMSSSEDEGHEQQERMQGHAEKPVLRQMMRFFDPVTVRIWGAHINRDTVENVRAAGFEDIQTKNLSLDVVRAISARAPGSSPSQPG